MKITVKELLENLHKSHNYKVVVHASPENPWQADVSYHKTKEKADHWASISPDYAGHIIVHKEKVIKSKFEPEVSKKYKAKAEKDAIHAKDDEEI